MKGGETELILSAHVEDETFVVVELWLWLVQLNSSREFFKGTVVVEVHQVVDSQMEVGEWVILLDLQCLQEVVDGTL